MLVGNDNPKTGYKDMYLTIMLCIFFVLLMSNVFLSVGFLTGAHWLGNRIPE